MDDRKGPATQSGPPLTVAQAAGRLAVAIGTVYDLCHQGRLAHLRIGTGRGTIRILEADLEAYLASCRVETGPRPGVRYRLRPMSQVPTGGGSNVNLAEELARRERARGGPGTLRLGGVPGARPQGGPGKVNYKEALKARRSGT